MRRTHVDRSDWPVEDVGASGVDDALTQRQRARLVAVRHAVGRRRDEHRQGAPPVVGVDDERARVTRADHRLRYAPVVADAQRVVSRRRERRLDAQPAGGAGGRVAAEARREVGGDVDDAGGAGLAQLDALRRQQLGGTRAEINAGSTGVGVGGWAGGGGVHGSYLIQCVKTRRRLSGLIHVRVDCPFNVVGTEGWRVGGMEGGRDGGWEGWRVGGMEGGRDGGWEGWRVGGMEGGRDGGWEGWRVGGMEGGRDGGWEGWRVGGMEGGRDGGWDGWRVGGMEGGRDGGWEGGSERGREGGRKGPREGGRKGGRE